LQRAAGLGRGEEIFGCRSATITMTMASATPCIAEILSLPMGSANVAAVASATGG
jgi:hypothetical protein